MFTHALSAVIFLLFTLLYTPCVAAGGDHEAGAQERNFDPGRSD
jgi:Fe2+ transport system protein B